MEIFLCNINPNSQNTGADRKETKIETVALLNISCSPKLKSQGHPEVLNTFFDPF